MEHLLLKAVATTTTDLSEFEAVISTSAIDREKDIVEPDAMVLRVARLDPQGKVVPLHWNHSSNPENIVGHVEPESVKAVADEVVASGKVDLDTDRGQQVWRLMKSNTIGFSFGYITTASRKRADGGRTITSLDVLEISATPAPMNPQTRVVATKALDDFDRVRAEARDRMLQLLTTDPAAEEKAIATDRPIEIRSFEC
jgi:HK97 family phage prohead protease